MASVEVGDFAPDLTLSTHTGDQISLADYRGERPIVVFFYPRDGMPVCTKEACYFRDAYEEFVDAGAVVIGVSADSMERHRTFAANHNLPFILASDRDGAARRAFGVPKSMGVFPGRVTYVIDQNGIVRHVFSSQMGASRHVTEALDVLRNLET